MSEVLNTIQNWNSMHQQTIGHKYMVCWGKDQKIMKDIITTYGQELTHKLMALFFKQLNEDKFLKSTGASIGVFKSQIPKLLHMASTTVEKERVGKL